MRQEARFGRFRLLASAAVLAAAAAALAAAPSGGARAGAAACGAWKIVGSPNVGSNPSTLTAVTAASSTEAWAVGNWYDGGAGVYHTLIERWNGTKWTTVPSADPGTEKNTLGGVATVSAGNAWAVGFSADVGSGFRTLTEHLTGGTWTAVTSPSPGGEESVLMAVGAAGSANDVWSVGYRQDAGQPRRTLVEHWNGTGWKVVKSPSLGSDDNILYGVTAVASDDVWAVGVHSVPWFQSLVLRWNGKRWKVVKSPNVGNGDNFLYDVAPTGGPQEVRSVGSWLGDEGTSPLALLWDGAKWTQTAMQDPPPGFDALFGLSGAAPSDVWAVGDQGGLNGQPFSTLAEHWDGSAWTIAPTPDKGSRGSHLHDVVHAPGTTDFWAVGSYTSRAGADRTLIELRCS